MPSNINPWWHKLEKNQFDGMSPRKEYDQVAQDIIDKNKDADVKLISKAVLRREYEYQASAHANRQPDDVKADAREIGNWFRNMAQEDADKEAMRDQSVDDAAQREKEAAEKQAKLDAEAKKADELAAAEAARLDNEKAKALHEKQLKEEEKKREQVEEDLKQEKEIMV